MTDKKIQSGLEMDARLVKERILMGVRRDKAAQAVESLKAFLDKHNWSQSALAKKLGVSPSVISQFLQGKYPGNVDEIVNKVVHLIDSVSRKDRRVKNKPYVNTSVAKRIGTLIAQTEAFGDDDEGKIGLIVGDGGHGKSHCLREYSRANKNTVYVELDDAMNPTMVFTEIAEKLGIYSAGSLATVTRRLIENLQNRHIIIMLDEASSLKVKQLNQLRQILVIKSRCPLILAGNSDLLRTVMQPTTRRGYESLDQFTSRLMCVCNLDLMASDKNGGLYSLDDMRNLYQYGGIRLTTDAVKTLRRICRTPRSGRLRTCSTLIAALHTAKVVTKAGQIDSDLIITVIEELDLPIKTRLPLVTRDNIAEEQPQAQAMVG